MRNRAYRYRIYPNSEQQIMLAKTFGCTRFIYNRMLEDKIGHYKKTGKMLQTTPARYKQACPWLKEVDSLALANAQLHLERAYKNFFARPETGFPKYKSKHRNRMSYTTNVVNGNIRLEGNHIRLPKIGKVKILLHRPVPETWELKSVTVTKNPSGKYYASMLFAYEDPAHEEQTPAKGTAIPEVTTVSEKEPPEKRTTEKKTTEKKTMEKKTTEKKVLGLDFSMHGLYKDSNGHEPGYPRYYRKAEERLKRGQRRLSRMQKGSSNRAKQRVKVARMHEKVANQRKDFLHKESRQIANACDVVCVEDLDMKAMAKSLHFGKSVSDNGWGMFLCFLEYKLEEQGKELVKVARNYPSSQTCHVCGYRNRETKDLSIRAWTCPVCGTYHDRDENAAINIRNEGAKLLSA